MDLVLVGHQSKEHFLGGDISGRGQMVMLAGESIPKATESPEPSVYPCSRLPSPASAQAQNKRPFPTSLALDQGEAFLNNPDQGLELGIRMQAPKLAYTANDDVSWYLPLSFLIVGLLYR